MTIDPSSDRQELMLLLSIASFVHCLNDAPPVVLGRCLTRHAA